MKLATLVREAVVRARPAGISFSVWPDVCETGMIRAWEPARP